MIKVQSVGAKVGDQYPKWNDSSEGELSKSFVNTWYEWLNSEGYLNSSSAVAKGRFGAFVDNSDGTNAPKSSHVLTLNLPFLLHPIWLRPNSSDISVFLEVFVNRIYFHKVLLGQSPRFIIDAGANIGLSAIFFAMMYPYARIICVEADSSNCILLRRNVKAYPNVEVFHAALWSSTSSLEIVNPHAEHWSYQMREAASSTCAIDGLDIGSLLRRCGETRIDILKIDIEGSEIEVFKESNIAWLSSVRLLMIELHDHLVFGCTRAVYSAAVKAQFTKYQSQNVDILMFDH